ncbi:MAG: flippase [Candidatus Aminicenantes bacterium]|nr:MAG: flippase [Candidatus Aminicenantes bacterium]
MLRKILNTKNTDFSLIRGLKNASYMSVGNLISQFVGLIGFIFIARLFGPKNYGIYTTVLAFVTFFHLFLFGGLAKAIIREGSKRKEDFEQILETTIGVRILFIILALFICLGATFFTNYPDYLKLFIIIYSSEIVYYGLDSFIGVIYQTTEKMQYLAYFSVSTRVLVTGLSIIFLFLGAGVLTILIINLLCKFAVLIVNFLYSKRYIRFKFNINPRIASPILKSMFIFTLIKFINVLAVKIDILMISLLSTSRDVGIYGVAHEIAREGLLLRNIVATAFFPIAVKFFHSNAIKIKTLLTYSIALFSAVFAGCFLLSFFAQDLVILVFGIKYNHSGYILSYLIFYLPLAFLTLPFATSLQATHNEKILLVVYSLGAALNAPLNIIFFYKYGLIGIAYSTLVVFFVQSLSISFLALRKLKAQGYLE